MSAPGTSSSSLLFSSATARTVVDDATQDNFAIRPERIGTWQFMSAAYIAVDWTRPIEVADELESFFHVMLFYAVRFLRNNLPSVAQFVIEYFNTFQMGSNGGLICSGLKRTTLRLGILEGFSTATLQFLKRGGQEGNPVNALIAKLLYLFKGRYEYLEYMTRPKKAPPAPSAASRRIGPSARRNVRRNTKYDAWRIDNDYSGVKPPLVVEEPSAHALNSKKILERHGGVLKLFNDALDEAQDDDWDDTGVVGYDQLLDYNPTIYIVAVKDAIYSDAGSKRFKGSHDVVSSAVLVPTDSVAGGLSPSYLVHSTAYAPECNFPSPRIFRFRVLCWSVIG
ncbi:hypothetical protein C8Q78DRAFT_1056817 [Trametes maxima]|nr:hypothetical protein C8Q78DRAFT_1056817 [Trametes maxima]